MLGAVDLPGVSVPTARLLRLVRAAAAAVVCLVTATGVHVTLGGHADPAALLVVLALVAGVAYALAGRRLTGAQMTGLLLLAQAVVHVASGPMESAGAGMALGHVAATAVSALVLTRGEAACWRLVELLGLGVVRLLAAARPLPAVARLAAIDARPVPVLPARRTPRLLRGPPLGPC
jgi:hypothetical protein